VSEKNSNDNNNNNSGVVDVLAAIFTVMCYNVLCDKYATRQLYGYCPSWALNWQHRRRHIFEEIHHYGADIISLQVEKLFAVVWS